MHLPFVLVVVLVLVLDPMAWFRGRGRGGVSSCFQCTVARPRRLSPNSGSPARFCIAPVFWRFGDGGQPTKSASRRRAEAALWRAAKAGGLAQSKTLPR